MIESNFLKTMSNELLNSCMMEHELALNTKDNNSLWFQIYNAFLLLCHQTLSLVY